MMFATLKSLSMSAGGPEFVGFALLLLPRKRTFQRDKGGETLYVSDAPACYIGGSSERASTPTLFSFFHWSLKSPKNVGPEKRLLLIVQEVILLLYTSISKHVLLACRYRIPAHSTDLAVSCILKGSRKLDVSMQYNG